jgi:hypothetical protein
MRSWDDQVENTYAHVQYWTIVSLLIGKVSEGLDVVDKRILR